MQNEKWGGIKTSNLITIQGVRGFIDQNGIAQLNLEDVSFGLGFYQTKNNVGYVRWETVRGYLEGFGFSQQVGKDTFIPENMFYLLAMKASNDTAILFQMKVANEILPSIRKTGTYIAPQIDSKMLYQIAAQLEEKEKQIALLAPKAEQYDVFMYGSNLQDMNSVAKCIGIGRNTLFKFLRSRKVLMASNEPYQEFIDRGYFEPKEKPIKMGEQVINKVQTFVTPKGVTYISNLIKEGSF